MWSTDPHPVSSRLGRLDGVSAVAGVDLTALGPSPRDQVCRPRCGRARWLPGRAPGGHIERIHLQNGLIDGDARHGHRALTLICCPFGGLVGSFVRQMDEMARRRGNAPGPTPEALAPARTQAIPPGASCVTRRARLPPKGGRDGK